MNIRMSALALAILVAAGACGRNNNRAADTSLNTDLSLAAQQSHSLDSLSAAERTPAPNALNGTAAAATSRPATRTTRTSTTHRSSGSSGRVYSSGGSATTSSGHIVKHTQRDAAIGAAAGAVIGATTSRNKVKGGIIGAAVGGILGGVIGNNVDKKRVP
ncbi:MAG TPA: glycine zipper domain-containing protein [Gemmatimonadaceae bacterium]